MCTLKQSVTWTGYNMARVIVNRALQFEQNGEGVFLHPSPLIQNIPAAWLCLSFIRENVTILDAVTETPEREQERDREDGRIKENNAYNNIIERGNGTDSKKGKRGKVDAE